MMKLIKKLRPNFKLSYFKKIFLYSISIIIITISINYILNIFFLNSFYINRKKAIIKESVLDIKAISSSNFELENYASILKEIHGIEFKIIPTDYFNTRNQGSMAKMVVPIPKFINLNKNGFNIINSQNLGIKFLSYTEELSKDEKIVYWTSLSVMDSHQHEFNIFNILATFISIIFTLIFTIFFSKKLTNDIKKLSKTAEDISNLKFPKEIIIKRDDELGDLSLSLNNMANKLESSITNLRAFVSNASHELKTPISVLSSYAQALVSKNVNSPEQIQLYHNTILKTTTEMQNLVEKLLTLSKITSLNYGLLKEKTSITKIIDESIEKYEFIELQKDIEIYKDIPNVISYCDPSLIKIAIENIIQNALKYSLPNTQFKILYVDNTFKFVNTYEVTNDKVLISKDHNEFFQPFFRGENSYNNDGTGLGLSIVKQILELHNLKFGISLTKDNFIFWFEV